MSEHIKSTTDETRQGMELIEMDSSLPKVRLVVSGAVYIRSIGWDRAVSIVVVNIYKYNRKIEHDRCRKRSTGTINAVVKKKRTWTGKIHCLFTVLTKVGLTRNDLLFENYTAQGCRNSDQRRRNYIRPSNQSCHIDLK